jgi:hypothetical protein
VAVRSVRELKHIFIVRCDPQVMAVRMKVCPSAMRKEPRMGRCGGEMSLPLHILGAALRSCNPVSEAKPRSSPKPETFMLRCGRRS